MELQNKESECYKEVNCGRHVRVKKYKSFVKSKRIFWKQGTDAKSLFSGMNRDKDG